ncbi:MAG: type IV pilus assembly protein PilM [Bdellovibrionales bacterium]|nr:type IV pilus assembly protein PilM [Bdellovibrionales bacterium]
MAGTDTGIEAPPQGPPTDAPKDDQAGQKKKASIGEKISQFFAKLKMSGVGAGGSSSSVIGLSVGSSSVKVVELIKKGKSFHLHHFGLAQLPEDAVINREIINPVAVIEAIKSLVAQIQIASRPVCTSISGNAVFIKRLTVEAPNQRELKEAVYWEAEQYLPFDPSEVVLDFHQIGKRDKTFDVLLVGAKRSAVESYVGCIEDAGLKAKQVDVDFFAMQDSFELNYPQNPAEAVCLVDVGASSTKISIVQEGVPVFTKDSPMGGAALTAEIQKQLNLNFTDAETLKTGAAAGGVPQEVSDLMAASAEQIAGEIKQTLEVYHATGTGAPVAYVLVSGGGSKVPQFAKIVEDGCGLPTQVANPFNAISYDSGVFTQEYLAQIAPLAAVPVGLALRAAQG